jgi:hypothetical protein
MSDVRHEKLERELRSLEAPDEAGAFDRGLDVVRAAHAGEARRPSRKRPAVRAVLGAAAAAATAVLLLTPAGASVRDWIEDAVTVENERIPPVRLPAEGTILTVNRDGAWLLADDGSRRRLGDYEQAAFSPHALNIAVASGDELLAVDPRGDLQWSISKPGRRIADPAWAPSALRIAYRAGSQLRIVEGDGSPDRLVAAEVAPVAPAWRPHVAGEPERDLLAYAPAGGGVRILDAAESGEGIAVATEDDPRHLTWLDDGRLVVAGDRAVEVFAPDGSRLARIEQPPGARVVDLEAEPGGERVAIVRSRGGADGPGSELVLLRLEEGIQRASTIFAGSGPIAGIAFSPDGEWLAVGWPQADSWLFERPVELEKLVERTEAAAGISAQFTPPGAVRDPGFPRIEEWVLPAEG